MAQPLGTHAGTGHHVGHRPVLGQHLDRLLRWTGRAHGRGQPRDHVGDLLRREAQRGVADGQLDTLPRRHLRGPRLRPHGDPLLQRQAMRLDPEVRRGRPHRHVEHRHLWRVRHDLHPVDPGQRSRDGPGVGKVGGHAVQPRPQAGQRAGGVGPQREHHPAVAVAPLPGPLDQVVLTHQAGTGDGPEALVERHVDAVEQRGDLGVWPVVAGGGLPQPRPVHVHGHAAFAGPRGLRLQCLPRRQPTADLPLRQLQQQRPRRFGDGLEVRQREQRHRGTDRPQRQPVQALRPFVLVQQQVGGRVHQRCRAADVLGVDAQGDLLGHRARRHEHRRRFSEQLGDLGLQLGDDPAAAVPVGPDLVGQLGQQVSRCALPVPVQEPVAPGRQRPCTPGVIHGRDRGRPRGRGCARHRAWPWPRRSGPGRRRECRRRGCRTRCRRDRPGPPT